MSSAIQQSSKPMQSTNKTKTIKKSKYKINWIEIKFFSIIYSYYSHAILIFILSFICIFIFTNISIVIVHLFSFYFTSRILFYIKIDFIPLSILRIKLFYPLHFHSTQSTFHTRDKNFIRTWFFLPMGNFIKNSINKKNGNLINNPRWKNK